MYLLVELQTAHVQEAKPSLSLTKSWTCVETTHVLQLCSKAYYSAARPTLKLIFVNCFKMGVTTALISDAFKLAGLQLRRDQQNDASNACKISEPR